MAQNRVAQIYAAGRGLDLSPVEAAKWHLIASKGGRPDAGLDKLVAGLTPQQRAEAEALAAVFEAEQPKGQDSKP